MGALTTHILDTAHGHPAAAVRIDLYAEQGAGWMLLRSVQTNSDGRCELPLLQGADLQPGRYRLVFHMGAYFNGLGLTLPQTPFLDQIPLEFGVADAGQHYHVPLLVSPWSYSTYRGS